jgi:hypothetical protein
MNGVRVHMPSLRELRPDGGLFDYVARFIAEKIDDPDRQVEQTMRAMRFLQDTRGDYDWPRNLRELKNHVDRFLLNDGADGARDPAVSSSVPPPASPAPEASPAGPVSVGLRSSGILGLRAKAGDIDADELLRSYVTRVHANTGQNMAETARRTRFNRRTVARWIDPERLARLLQAPRSYAGDEGAAGDGEPGISGQESTSGEGGLRGRGPSLKSIGRGQLGAVHQSLNARPMPSFESTARFSYAGVPLFLARAP